MKRSKTQNTITQNINTIKSDGAQKLKPRKQIIVALAIILLIAIPLTISHVSITSTPAPTISAVQSGTMSTSSITLGPKPNPIYTTVMIDIRIDNSPGIWGWFLPTVSWNATVLQLIKATGGPFLANNAPGDDTPEFTGSQSSLFDNVNGQILGGLAGGIEGADVSTEPSGVLATLTFNITNYGVSPITISSGYVVATSVITAPHNDVTCDSATVTVSNTTTSNLSSATLQVFTGRGSRGSSNGGTYGPQDLLQIYGLVTSQNVSVPDQTVSFSLQNPNGTVIAVGDGLTNQTGIANVQYRLPAPNPNATEIVFGIWNITASINLSSSTLTNSTSFTFNYLSNIESIQMPASVNLGQTLPIELTIDNGLFSTPSSELDITVFDHANVPIGSFTYRNTMQLQNFTVVDLTISIPQWAFTGQATAYMCLLTANGTALAPETAANFQILP